MLEFIFNEQFSNWRVKLDGKPVGTIRHFHEKGYQYTPDRQKQGGEFFQSLHECKRSLQGVPEEAHNA